MIKKIACVLIHPVFVFVVISVLQCIPTEGPMVYNVMPKEGDNFKTKEVNDVFCYLNGGKYQYTSEQCYFKHGNPPYSAHYKQGGIMVVTDEIANKIPRKGQMCKENSLVVQKKEKLTFAQKYLTVTFFLGYFSSTAHVFFYILFAISMVYHFLSNNKKYLYAFLGGFLGGVFLELIQHFFIEGRSASVEDIVLNGFGTIIGMISFWAVKKYTKWLDIKP